MFVRNSKGEIITFEPKEFFSEYNKYTKLWKIKYNMDLDKPKETFRAIINYVNGMKDSV